MARDYRVAYGETAGTWHAEVGVIENWRDRFDQDIQRIFVNTNQPTYEDILLNQTFWVGDGRDKFEVVDGNVYFLGRTGYSLGPATRGEVQYFKIPPGATRLYLGFADGQGFGNGDDKSQGCYGDDQGTLAVSGTFWGPQPTTATLAEPTPVPTLGEWSLMLLGLLAAGLGAGRLRRRA